MMSKQRKDLKLRIKNAANGNSDIDKWLNNFLNLHRLRWHINAQCVARVVIGGKTSGYWGRFPGILEEILLAIQSRKPVYVIGGFGGTATAVGEILGLSRANNTSKQLSMQDPFETSGVLKDINRDVGEQALKELSDLLCGRDQKLFPLTFGEAVDLLWENAIGGSNWVDNGLSKTENRKLFESTDYNEICDLLTKGIEHAVALGVKGNSYI